MPLGKTLAIAVVGVHGHLIEAHALIEAGPSAFTVAGPRDTSLNESRDRVRAAIVNSGHRLPAQRISVELSPAGLLKHGTGSDLAIATAVLSAANIIPAGRPE